MNWTPVILQFLQTSLVIIIGGLLAGGGLGLFFGWLFKLLYKAVPGLRAPFMLFPWRTMLLAAVVAVCTPFLYYILRPEQAFSPVLTLAILFALLVFFLVVDRLLSHWLPTGLGVKFTGLVRSLAVFCVAIGLIGADPSQEGLLRFSRMEVAKTFTMDSLWIMLGIVSGLGLGLDLLLGIVQMLFGLRDRKKLRKTPVEAVG